MSRIHRAELSIPECAYLKRWTEEGDFRFSKIRRQCKSNFSTWQVTQIYLHLVLKSCLPITEFVALISSQAQHKHVKPGDWENEVREEPIYAYPSPKPSLCGFKSVSTSVAEKVPRILSTTAFFSWLTPMKNAGFPTSDCAKSLTMQLSSICTNDISPRQWIPYQDISLYSMTRAWTITRQILTSQLLVS